MRFVLILTIALIVCAHAAPQFNNFDLPSEGWGSTDIFITEDRSRTRNEKQNQDKGLVHHTFPVLTTFAQHRRPNNYGQQIRENDERSSNQCWDPVNQSYRDSPNRPSQYYSQSSTDNYSGMNNYDYYPMHQYPYIDQSYDRNWDHYRPQQYGQRPHRGYGPPPSHHHGHGSPPSSHHHHGHGPPPSSHHHHGHGPPPSSHHHHGHGPPSHHQHGPHHDRNGPQPLPSRPPHHQPNRNEYELELCTENSQESVSSGREESSTSGNYDVADISTSPAVPGTSVKPEDLNGQSTATQSTIDNSVIVTTEFDWNNYRLEASVDNTGGAGVIDVRGKF